MDTDLILPVLSRWIHVGTAIVLVGGTAFFRFVVVPSLGDDSSGLVGRIRDRWKKIVHAGIGLFILSGAYNFALMIPKHTGDKLYHPLLGIKMLLALVVFFLASALVGNKAGTQKFRDDSKKWTSIMLLLAAVIVGISGFVKVRPYSPAAAASVEADTDEAESNEPADPATGE